MTTQAKCDETTDGIIPVNDSRKDVDEVEAQIDAEFDELLEDSSLGSPAVRYIRSLAPSDVALRSKAQAPREPIWKDFCVIDVRDADDTEVVDRPGDLDSGQESVHEGDERCAEPVASATSATDLRDFGDVDDFLLQLIVLSRYMTVSTATTDSLRAQSLEAIHLSSGYSRDQIRRLWAPRLRRCDIQATWLPGFSNDQNVAVITSRILQSLVERRAFVGVREEIAKQIVATGFAGPTPPAPVISACLAALDDSRLGDSLATEFTTWLATSGQHPPTSTVVKSNPRPQLEREERPTPASGNEARYREELPSDLVHRIQPSPMETRLRKLKSDTCPEIGTLSTIHRREGEHGQQCMRGWETVHAFRAMKRGLTALGASLGTTCRIGLIIMGTIATIGVAVVVDVRW